jgi:hypothetical protein
MSLQLNTYLGYRNYFQNLATQHVDIEGFQYGNDKVISFKNKSGLPSLFMQCLPYEKAKYDGPNLDQQYRRKRARYAIMKIRGGDTFEAENADYIQLEAIALQVNARILYRDKQNLGVIVDVNSIEMDPFETTVGATKYRGIEVGMDVKDNAGMALDVSKWNDLTP